MKKFISSETKHPSFDGKKRGEPSVTISNGSYKFHLAPLAAELARRNRDVRLLVAGWPVGWQKRFAKQFRGNPRWVRFLDRGEEIDNQLVCSSVLSEVFLKIGDLMRSHSKNLQQHIQSLGFRVYSAMASRDLRRYPPAIYHYRCCFGRKSVAHAKRLGSIALCDHSIAHPRVLDYMVENAGKYPPKGGTSPVWPLSRFSEMDLAQADHTVVNSEFVKKTCVHAGMPPDRVHVIHLGVDDQFIAVCPDFDEAQVRAREEQLYFAGGWQRRKGVITIIEALEKLNVDCRLDIFAGIEPELARDKRCQKFLESERVKHIGMIPRSQLAVEMTKYSILVFPSYCEGSARVIFEAMACGCAILTTPNSGSIVEDGVHGRLVPAGDAGALSETIEWMLYNRTEVARMGWHNARLVRESFLQSHYADAVEVLYASLINSDLTIARTAGTMSEV